MNKVGRNDPCPCGSGKKYKQCCLPLDDSKAAAEAASKAKSDRTLQSAVEQYQAGHLPEAEALCQQVLQTDAEHAEALHLLGVFALQTGKSAVAIEYFNRAICARPAPHFYSNLGNAYRASKNLDDAVACYQKALALNPNSAEAYNNLGTSFTETGKPDEAIDCFRKALKIRPGYVEAYNNLGGALKGRGKLDEAMDCYRKTLSIMPDYVGAYYNLAIILQEQGKLDQAIASFQKALAIKPDYVAAYNNMGNAYKGLSMLDDAIACYQKAVTIKPDHYEAYYNFGIVLHDKGKLDEAMECYRKALAIKPDYAAAYFNLGNALVEKDDPEEAIACFQKAVAIAPDYAEAYNNLGIAFNNRGKQDDAVACFQKVLAFKPDYAEAYHNMGTAVKEQGRFDDATRCFEKSLAIRPNYADAYNNLGRVYTAIDRLDEAIAVFQQALLWEPGNMPGLDAAVRIATLAYLRNDLQQAAVMIARSRSILEQRHLHAGSTQAYWQLIDLLLLWWKANPPAGGHQQAYDTLYVIGDSHILATQGMVVMNGDQAMRCQGRWIEGCKQWHLGNDRENQYKRRFAAIVAALPGNAPLLLSIGEIDCRGDEGIFKTWKKSQGKTLEEVALTTITNYLKYLAKVASPARRKIILCGIPATNVSLNSMAPADAETFVNFVQYFNRMMKQHALDAGMDFLDLFSLTDNGKGISNQQWHIDTIHVRPDTIVNAFQRHYCQSGTSHAMN